MVVSRRLIILEGTEKHREIVPEGETLEIGRAPAQGVVLSDRRVSRRHAIIRKRDDDLVIEDAGSTFGTLVNGQLLGPGMSAVLKDGDVIELGKVQIVCHFDAPRGEPDAMASFAAQANARLILLEGQQIRRLPLAGPLVLIGRAPHCEVRLQGEHGAPEHALIRAKEERFQLEPRCAASPPLLNEHQVPVRSSTPLESNSVFLLGNAQILFLHDFDAHGRPIEDPLLGVSRRRLLRHISKQTGLAYWSLKAVLKDYHVLGQKTGEVLVREGLITPLHWRVICARLWRAPGAEPDGPAP